MLSGDFWPSCEAKGSNIPIDRSTRIKSMQALNSLHVEYASSTFQELCPCKLRISILKQRYWVLRKKVTLLATNG